MKKAGLGLLLGLSVCGCSDVGSVERDVEKSYAFEARETKYVDDGRKFVVTLPAGWSDLENKFGARVFSNSQRVWQFTSSSPELIRQDAMTSKVVPVVKVIQIPEVHRSNFDQLLKISKLMVMNQGLNYDSVGFGIDREGLGYSEEYHIGSPFVGKDLYCNFRAVLDEPQGTWLLTGLSREYDRENVKSFMDSFVPNRND